LATFSAGFVAAALAWRGSLGWWWLAGAAAVFVVLAWRHSRVVRARRDHARAARFYERGLSRIDDSWPGTGGESGERFRSDEHLFANDLDLFGEGSLFELLSLAHTGAGEAQLAQWLRSPATADEIGRRQRAVDELAPRLDLREALALADSRVGLAVDGQTLVEWAWRGPRLSRAWGQVFARSLTTAMLLAAGWWVTTDTAGPFFAVAVVQIAFAVSTCRRVQQALHGANSPARELDAIALVLGHLESDTFTSARLVALQRSVERDGVRGSAAIRKLHRLVEFHDWQHNQIFAPVGAALLWGTHIAWAIEAWRRDYGPLVAAWLLAVGEFEALNSLAAYRYEHPDDVWPEIIERDTPNATAIFDGTALGHPLLPRERSVPNDVRIGVGTNLLMVSGSNMSGKSTLLRTVGVNAVLALAGAPVRAAALRLTPVAIGATLRIQDSLQRGRSRFYAEVIRVREIVEAGAGPLPLLFLFDEIFQGTNSHDRLAGSAGVLRSLLGRPAIGVVTTHDMALTGLGDALGTRLANVHFEDRLVDGELVFDYRMKPGPVTRGNGVALMRAVGLDVEDQEV